MKIANFSLLEFNSFRYYFLQEGVTVAKQHRKVERVSYCGRTFVISLEVGGASCSDHTHSKRNKHWGVAMREMMDNSADFPPKAHHLTRW